MSTAGDLDRKWNGSSNDLSSPCAEELQNLVAERTAELRASEERFRTLVEHAPEAILVFDTDAGHFILCNENASRLFGYSREELLQLDPIVLSPLAQRDGTLSAEASRRWTARALAGETPNFEWTHRHASGQLVDCEIRLVRLPGERNLVRGSVIDRTERTRRERTQRATYQISEAVHTVEDLDSLYARLHAIIRGLMPAHNFYIVLHDPISDQHFYAYHRDETDSRPGPRRMDSGLNGYVLRTGQALLATRQSMTDERSEWRLRSGTPSAIWLGVPLTLRGKTFGVMAVQDYHDERAYGENEKQVLLFVAAQIASAIDRKRREGVQHATYAISEAVHAAGDLDTLYTRIHGIVKGLMSAENFYIALLDPRTQLVSFPYFVDEMQPLAPPPRQVDTGLTGYVLRTREPLLASEARPKTRAHTDEGVLLEGLRMPYLESGSPAAIWLGAPLNVGGQTIGVMAVQDYRDAQAYGEGEKQILTFVAAQVAAAIDRKRAERTLRESEEKFRALFEATSQGVMLHDEEKFLEVNPAAVRILGFESAEEIIGHPPVEFAAPVQPGGETPEALARRYIDQCMTTRTARFDWVCRNPHGQEIPIEVILTRIQWSGRQVIQAVINDIRERKQNEEALRQKNRELLTLLETLPGYAFFKDAQGRYVMANENFARAVGHTPETIAGKTDRDLFPPELAEKFRADDARLLAAGEALAVGEETMIEGGRTFVVQTTKVPVKNDRCEVVGLIGLGFDVTERKQAEAELLKSLAREKELGQLKSNFVSMVSHEFRTPLGIIMSSADILRDYFEQLEPGERQDHLGSIHKNTRRMAELMEEVLVLSRFDAGRMQCEPAPMDLRAFCARVANEVASATNEICPIHFEYLPRTTTAKADERLLQHVFTNLLSNAVKYSEPGSTVDFIVERDGNNAVVRVRDRGIGIPENERGWLFEAFRRGRNVGQRAGTGLGLTIVKRCLDLHGGRIAIESAPGAGTTVTVTLLVFL